MILKFGTRIKDFFYSGKEVPSPVAYSVLCMVGGSMIAACWDLTFDLQGSIIFMFNCQQ